MKIKATKYPGRDYMFVVKLDDSTIDTTNEATIEIGREIYEGRSTEVPEPTASIN